MDPPRVTMNGQEFYPEMPTITLRERPVETIRVVRYSRGPERRRRHDKAAGLVPPRRPGNPSAYPSNWNTDEPECSLNLFCRRTSKGGYVGNQIKAIKPWRYKRDKFEKKIRENPHLVYNDRKFFEELNRAYYTHMCGFWRRWLSLKTLRTFQLVQVR